MRIVILSMMNAREAADFRTNVQEFFQAMTHRASDGFPKITEVAREIESLLKSLDLLHLHFVPITTLKELSERTAEAKEHVQFMIDSHLPEDAFHRGQGRPQIFERNSANINSRWGQLESSPSNF